MADRGPPHLRREQIDNAGNAAIEALHNNQAKLTSGAISTAATITELLTAAVLVLFTLIFSSTAAATSGSTSPRSSRPMSVTARWRPDARAMGH
ncbi:putative membrane protein [Mycobacterium ulcerans str. Harvey]|uniref:Membrane protein n=1 Tax=Mycobacterium ulcerans str. Harvey TaxID=1299332 RepID=A0ABN0R3B0_MYCUL|nr:putative membrane protein [Mycobacterium ulcerans str. Harvey]